MNIIVLIKEVPDMKRVRFHREKGVVDRSSADAEINPFDLNALQLASDLKRTSANGSVTALSMGPPKAERSLRDAFARGADRLVLLTDRRFGGADTWATARTLSAWIMNSGEYDLILCGEKSVDGDTAQIGAEVAEFLGIPHAYYVDRLTQLDHQRLEVEIEQICGARQSRTLRFPALISVTKNINKPTLPTVERKLESLETSIETVNLEALSDVLTEEETGRRGSPTKVQKIEIPDSILRVGKIYRENSDEFIDCVISEVKG